MTRDRLLAIARCDLVRWYADEILAAIHSGSDWTGPCFDVGVSFGSPRSGYVVRAGELRRVIHHVTSEGDVTIGWHTEPLDG